MKRLLFFACASLLLWGCTENKTVAEQPNPYRPIKNLVIPQEVAAGELLVMTGQGFASDCSVAMTLNSTGKLSTVQVVEVNDASLSVAVPGDLQMGFYSIRLTQNKVSTTIGGVNVKTNQYTDADFQLFTLAGSNLEIYPTSVAKQVRSSTPLANSQTSIPQRYSGYIEALPNGEVYYAGFESDQNGILHYSVGSYNMVSKVNTPPVAVPNFVAMGHMGNDFCILKTGIKMIDVPGGEPVADQDWTTFTLYKRSADSETKVRDFDMSSFGGGRLIVSDLRFLYYEKDQMLLLSGSIGTGESTSKVTFSLNTQTGAVTKNGGSSEYYYWYSVAGDQLYCFAVKYNEDTDSNSTEVLRINNAQQWTLSGSGAELVTRISSSGLVSPTYSPESGMIYGFDDIEYLTAILTFNPSTGTVDRLKWVNPGVAGIFYAPQSDETN